MFNMDKLKDAVLAGSEEGFTFALDVDGLRILSPDGNHSSVYSWHFLQGDMVYGPERALEDLRKIAAGEDPRPTATLP